MRTRELQGCDVETSLNSPFARCRWSSKSEKPVSTPDDVKELREQECEVLESIYGTNLEKGENSLVVIMEGYEPSPSWGDPPDLRVEFWLGLNMYPMDRPVVTVTGGGLPFSALKSVNDVTLATWDWDDDRAGEPVCFEVIEAVRDGIAEWITEYEDSKNKAEVERRKQEREKAKNDAEEQNSRKKQMNERERREYAKAQLGGYASSSAPSQHLNKPDPRANMGVSESELVFELFNK